MSIQYLKTQPSFTFAASMQLKATPNLFSFLPFCSEGTQDKYDYGLRFFLNNNRDFSANYYCFWRSSNTLSSDKVAAVHV